MKYASNPFTHALRSGKPQIGLWVCLSGGYPAEVVAPTGYDWVVIDMEHSPNDLMSVMAQLQVFEVSETVALVRPDWNDTVQVKRLLDIGAPGLVFPMVQSVAEAEAAVAATRYPPRGVRGVSGSNRANKFGRVRDYFDRVEEELTVIVQLETREAIAQAIEIGNVDGVSGVFFGPADITADMGLLGDVMNKGAWEDVIMPAARALMDNGVPVGTLVLDPDFAAKLLKDGFTFVACGVDTALLANASDNLLAKMKVAIR